MQRMTNNRKLAKAACMAGLAALALASSGCTRLRTHQGYVGNEDLVKAVQVGVDNKQSVEATLGRPTFVGQFDTNDWYYYARDSRQLAFSQPKAFSQLVFHVRFDPAGNVASVNRSGIENIVKINPEGDKTPTLGRERGFFEEFFGNIGTVGAPGAGGGGPR
ncbi:MAG: outer membrane protein assembly factor BamE [Sphingorhabdus sp.]